MNEINANDAAPSETDADATLDSLESVAQQEEGDLDRMPQRTLQSVLQWLAFNLGLFVLYVGFFHLCLVTQFPISLMIGVVIAATMTYLCVRFYRLFANRYEFLFYLALPLDVVLEGLIPFHSGYSFYWCAAAFWSVFGTYRVYRLVAKG